MEWLLYRNESEAVEDDGGFADKRSGSVEGDGLFVRNRIYLHRSGWPLERQNVVYLT